MNIDEITFDDLSEELPEELKPPIFRENLPDNFLSLTPSQYFFRQNGYLVLRDFLDHDAIDAYCARFIADRGDKSSPIVAKKWRPNVPYSGIPEIRDLCLMPDLMSILSHLIGYPMGMHLNLCEWVSTERDFHMDDYLNPEFVNNHYLAVWFALDDIHIDSGPFQHIEGSHKWPLMRRSKVFSAAPAEMKNSPQWNTHWPSMTQEFVAKAIEKEHAKRGGQIYTFNASKGDVLIWAGSLVHRGSQPKVRGMERKAIISHYSSIQHRKDMPRIAYHDAQRMNPTGAYFVL